MQNNQRSITVEVSIDPRIKACEVKYGHEHLFIESSIRVCTQHIITSCYGLFEEQILPTALVIAKAFELQMNFIVQQNFERAGLPPLTYGIGVTGTYTETQLFFTWFVRDENCQYNQDQPLEFHLHPIKH